MTVLDTLLTAVTDFTAAVPMQIPDPDPELPPGTEGQVSTVIAWLRGIGFAIIGGALIVGGILIGVSFRRGEGHDALPKILWPMAGAIVVGGAIAWVSFLIGS